MEKQIELMEKAKYLINELSKVQELYYDNLLDEINVVEGEEDWLFDYIFNLTVENSTFAEYLKEYGKEISDIINE